jgi:K+-transporting ATPase ATPase C chain
MRRQLLPALLIFLVLTLLTGVLYPLAVTAVAQVAFPGRADGSLIERDDEVVGSRLIGQGFAGESYFHPRPSAAGDGYDGASSSASNLGPTNDDLLTAVGERVDAFRDLNGLARDVKVPVDAVTSSGSGLDPHISPENARLQASRVARSRGVQLSAILALVEENTDGRSLGFLGEAGVNVLELNLALDAPRP